VAVVEPQQRPVRGQIARLERPARVVGDHERGAVRAKQVVHWPDEPALVAELEAVAPRRKQRQRGRQPLVVAPEVCGELPDDRPELARHH